MDQVSGTIRIVGKVQNALYKLVSFNDYLSKTKNSAKLIVITSSWASFLHNEPDR